MSIFKAFPKLSIKKIKLPKSINGRETQFFVNHCAETFEVSIPPTENYYEIKDDEVSTVFQDQNNLIYKFVKPRKWHEYYKTFYGRSRTSKEVLANVRLKELGFSVPVIHEFSIAVVPTHFKGYTGYYIMEPVNGLGDAQTYFKDLSHSAREKFVNHLINDLNKLKKNRIVYADLSLSNIFCSIEGDLCWIDTAIKEYPESQKGKFVKDWDKSFNKLMAWEKKLKILSESELLKIRESVT